MTLEIFVLGFSLLNFSQLKMTLDRSEAVSPVAGVTMKPQLTVRLISVRKINH